MNFKKLISIIMVLTMTFSCFCACGDNGVSSQTGAEAENNSDVNFSDDKQNPENTQNSDNKSPVTSTVVDIETDGGIVIVGTICVNEQEWYIQTEQPLNIKFEYIMDKPSVFTEQTKIKMFAPEIDGVEKAVYIGQTVTAEGTLSFYRDDFETLYFLPYTITLGKNAESCYSAPGLQPPEEPENLYDPSIPLPKYMDTMIVDGEYSYNAFMLSRETLEFMGNGFADFYVGFVDAFLNYKSEFPCPEKRYADMLSTVIYDEFPLYNACAEPFSSFEHYDPEKGTVSIEYKYDREKFDEIVDKFFDAANKLLTAAKPDQTDEEKARNIYHAVATSMTYDNSAMEVIERKESYYAYLYNSGVCITFANVYNQLLTQVGIQTTLAHCDNTDTDGHSWSVITLDGKQYFCDPTYELSYDNGNGYRFYGMNYADRTADGTGSMGIRYGRYNVRTLDSSMIATESLAH